MVRTGRHLANPNNLIYDYLPPHLEAGFASGRFKRMPIEVAQHLIGRLALLATLRIAAGEAASDYPEHLVTALLRALGLTPARAEKIVSQPLAAVPGAGASSVERATVRAAASPGWVVPS